MSLQETNVRCPVADAASSTGRLTLTVRGASAGGEAAGELALTPGFMERFELVRLLGRGTSGMVFLARQKDVDRPVAIKVLMRLEEVERARFVAEGRLLGQLAHPNIVRIYDVGMLGEHPYLVCAYQEGGTLKEKLARGRLSRDEAVQVALDVAAGLAACHQAGVVHRDVKPDNILFGADGQALLSDLGIARHFGRSERLTQNGALIGTPVYMAPEQIRGDEASAASDIYATGLVLLEMLTGKPAFPQATLLELLEAKAKPLPITRDLMPDEPLGLVAAVNAAVAFRASERPRTAEDLRQRLENAVRPPRPLPALPAATPRRARPWTPVLAVALMVACALPILAVAVRDLFHPLRVLEQKAIVDVTSAVVKLRTSEACQVELRYAPAAGGPQRVLRGAGLRRDHEFRLEELAAATHYRVEAHLSYGWQKGKPVPIDLWTHAHAPFAIFNIHVDEYETKAVVTWETDRRADTTVKYGRTEQYEDLRTNPEQKSETIHSITLEGLNPDTTYHYQILASDPRGRARPTPSADLQFRTGKEDQPPESPLMNLTRAYLDKFPRMTPEERASMRRLVERSRLDPVFTPPPPEVLRKAPDTDAEFAAALLALRVRVVPPLDAHKISLRMLLERHVNRAQAARRLHRALTDLAAKRPVDAASVGAALVAGEVPAGAPGPAKPLPSEARLALIAGERHLMQGEELAAARAPEARAELTFAIRQLAIAARHPAERDRALRLAGRALIVRAESDADLARAIGYLEKARVDVRVKGELALATAMLGQHDRAMAHCQDALALDASNAHALEIYALVLDAAHAAGKPLFDLAQRAAKASPTVKDRLRFEARFMHATQRGVAVIAEALELSAKGELTEAKQRALADAVAADPAMTLCVTLLFTVALETGGESPSTSLVPSSPGGMVGAIFLGGAALIGGAVWLATGGAWSPATPASPAPPPVTPSAAPDH